MKVITMNPTNGIRVLENPTHNKGTAFSLEEREKLALTGLLPDGVDTIEMQKQRVMGHLAAKSTDLERYIYLISLADRDEVLFYHVVMSDPARFIPILYDPTVGEACLKFDEIYRRPRGMYLSLRYQGHLAKILANWPVKDIRFICVSTGERILGLGDLGANGMGIPIGKLQLYTACAAIAPDFLLPVLLDCGTNNEKLLQDPLYLGLKQPRPSESQMDEFVDEFIQATQTVFPHCCVHFEDWKGVDAVKYLAKYKDKVCCYNDDIQGTASIVLSGLLTSTQVKGEQLKDQRFLFLGAGSAGSGIAELLISAMKEEGLTEQEAIARISFFDVNGLIEKSRKDLMNFQQKFAKESTPTKDLVQVINSFKPTTLIGVSTKARAFTQQVVEAMCQCNERPIIFALSNPTSKAECTAQEAYTWSKGKALFAAGVQFPAFTLNGKTFMPGQANNFYIFPAVSLAVLVTKAKHIPDSLFIEAARATSAQVSTTQREQGLMFPLQTNILETEITTAVKVVEKIVALGLAQVTVPQDVNAWIRQQLYKPEYGKFIS